MILPTFTPHANFDTSACAYLGADVSSSDSVRILVDFEPILGDPGDVDIYIMSGNVRSRVVILDKRTVR